MADAVGQDGFQGVECVSGQVGVLVDDDACEVLPGMLRHDAGFAVLDGEAFFQCDSGYVYAEAFSDTRQPLATRKGKVVCIAGVVGSERCGEGGKADVEPVSAQVCKGG